MGKNQAYKAIQKARVGSSSAGPLEVEDGMVDGSFHSPEWHAARLASLKTSHTITWEEFKKKQKEDEIRKGEMEADTDRLMREYRAQLDAERAQKLSHGRNRLSSKSKDNKKDRKDRDLKRPSGKGRKHSRRKSYGSSSSASSTDLSSSEEEEREWRRSKSRSKRTKKDKKQGSKSKHPPSDDDEEHNGPVPLSRFFESAKS